MKKGGTTLPPKVTEEYKEQKKKDVLTSAMACFAEKGYQAATIDDIVAHSGMSKGALYNYFKSKEEIYLALQEEATKKTFERLHQNFTPEMTASEKLHQLFSMNAALPFQEEKTRKWASVQLEFWINASRNPELKEKMRERLAMYRTLGKAIIQEGQATGEFRKDADQEVIAESFWALLDGAFLHVLVDEEAYPFKNLFLLHEKLIMNELKA